MPTANRLKEATARFCRDTSGIILPYVTLILVVIVGLSVLAVDGARYMSLQTQLQKAADSLALAAAAELDGLSDSITRANAAINNLITNKTLYASGTDLNVRLATGGGIRYLSGLPASDADPITNAFETADASLARYVEVTVQPVALPTILPAAFFGGVTSMTAGAQAVAGFPNQVICDIPPVFICNPYETSGMTDPAATSALRTALADAATRRRSLRMDSSQTTPGHFGFLVPPDGCNGASCLELWIARSQPNACFSRAGVDLNTGKMTSVKDGFNVRFDLYRGNLSKLNTDSTYAPSVNVRKSYLPPVPKGKSAVDWCNAAPSLNNTLATYNKAVSDPVVRGLPHDGMIGTWNGICASGTCLQGDGNWNCAEYWTTNHTASAPTGCTATNPTISRYEVYRYEIDNNLVADFSGNRSANTGVSPAGNGESGTPYCAGSGVDTSTGGADRRVIKVAVVNCLAQSGSITGGSTANNIPVAGFAKFFLTQPIGADSTEYLYGELSGLVGLNDHVRILNQVQLYR